MGACYKSSRLSLPEHECQVHVVPYIHRGPFGARIWEERDPVTHQLIAIHEAINTYGQHRTIWMDGRPHPSPNAPHTWMGFSTGVWEGNMLTVTTTHVKQGWYRRSNIPSSDEQTTDRTLGQQRQCLDAYQRHRRSDLSRRAFDQERGPQPQSPIRISIRSGPANTSRKGNSARGEVPHYLPGENPWVAEYAAQHNLPQEVTLGGPATMYPEYRTRMKTLPVAVFTHARRDLAGCGPAPPAGAGWRTKRRRGCSRRPEAAGGAAPAGGRGGAEADGDRIRR